MKQYYIQYGIGKAKYVVSHHDGSAQNKDGSPFYGITIFKNKKALGSFVNQLRAYGYVERGWLSS